MTLDDVYAADLDRIPLAHEAADWDEEDLGLVWDEAEVRLLAHQLDAARGALD